MSDLQLRLSFPAPEAQVSAKPAQELSNADNEYKQRMTADLYQQNLIELARQKVRPFLNEDQINDVVGEDGRIDYMKLAKLIEDSGQTSSALLTPAGLLDITA